MCFILVKVIQLVLIYTINLLFTYQQLLIQLHQLHIFDLVYVIQIELVLHIWYLIMYFRKVFYNLLQDVALLYYLVMDIWTRMIFPLDNDTIWFLDGITNPKIYLLPFASPFLFYLIYKLYNFFKTSFLLFFITIFIHLIYHLFIICFFINIKCIN